MWLTFIHYVSLLRRATVSASILNVIIGDS